jgi:hypothetical protein
MICKLVDSYNVSDAASTSDKKFNKINKITYSCWVEILNQAINFIQYSLTDSSG